MDAQKKSCVIGSVGNLHQKTVPKTARELCSPYCGWLAHESVGETYILTLPVLDGAFPFLCFHRFFHESFETD
jgi:hypothetical protein